MAELGRLCQHRLESRQFYAGLCYTISQDHFSSIKKGYQNTIIDRYLSSERITPDDAGLISEFLAERRAAGGTRREEHGGEKNRVQGNHPAQHHPFHGDGLHRARRQSPERNGDLFLNP